MNDLPRPGEDVEQWADRRARRELCAPDGGAFDPEKKIVITERGRFVLRHGYAREMW